MNQEEHYIDDFSITLNLAVTAVWQKESRGSRERGSGVPLEPDEPAGWEILRILVHGVDITAIFSDADLERLQEALFATEEP
jgi:hypothetical protein